jgi:hypothetical protein
MRAACSDSGKCAHRNLPAPASFRRFNHAKAHFSDSRAAIAGAVETGPPADCRPVRLSAPSTNRADRSAVAHLIFFPVTRRVCRQCSGQTIGRFALDRGRDRGNRGAAPGGLAFGPLSSSSFGKQPRQITSLILRRRSSSASIWLCKATHSAE